MEYEEITEEFPLDQEPTAIVMVCSCGLYRFLPEGIKPGDKVELAPCLRCHTYFRGTFTGTGVQEDVPDLNITLNGDKDRVKWTTE